MSGGLKGDVKRLTNFTQEYRLRVGDYRILFEIAESVHRKKECDNRMEKNSSREYRGC